MKKPPKLSPARQAMLREVEADCAIARVRLGEATRADIGRAGFIDRSTLTRNLKLLINAGWVEEIPSHSHGRSRPLRLS